MLAPFVKPQKLRVLSSTERKADLEFLRELIEAGKVTPVIDRTYPLSEVPDAIRYLETGTLPGQSGHHCWSAVSGEGRSTLDAVKIQLSALWVALMLTYLLGDVLRIFSGDFKAGEIGGMRVTQAMWLGIAVLMVIPVVMVVLSLTLDYPVNRWVNIVVAVGFFLFNLVGLPTYPSMYDKFLIVVGLVFNVVTVWFAWNWTST